MAKITPSSPAAVASSSQSRILETTVELSVRLLHADTKIADALKVDHGMVNAKSDVGSLWYATAPAHAPAWASFLERGSPGISSKLSSQHSSAVLFVEGTHNGTTRMFAICFGQGHHNVNDDRIERQFGLRVVLNCVKRNELRTLDIASLESTVMQRRTQSSRDSDLRDFGLDIDRDLLRLASGRPSDAAMAKAMAGKDALLVRKKIAYADLPKFCGELLRLHSLQDYRDDFAFIDRIKPLYKSDQIEQLDAIAFTELKNVVAGQPSDLHLAIPDIVTPGKSTEIAYYGNHLNSGKKTTYPELDISDYAEELKKGDFGKISGMPEIRSTHQIRAVGKESDAAFGALRVYQCFVFETLVPGTRYVLFDGQWFEVEGAYAKEIDDAYCLLLKPAFIASTKAPTEQDLIAELTASHPDLLCLDQTKTSPAGAAGANLEVCDFLSHSKQLIHLKDGHDSSPLSHLWNQALVSAESLKRDDKFCSDVREHARKRERKSKKSGFVALLPKNRQFKPSDYTIVFGVMRHRYKRTNTLGLPFFSKVALIAVANRLTMMTFNVELHLIEKI